MPKTDNNRQDFSDQDSKSQEKEINQSDKGGTKEASFEDQDDESNVDKEKAYGAQAQHFRERYKKSY